MNHSMYSNTIIKSIISGVALFVILIPSWLAIDYSLDSSTRVEDRAWVVSEQIQQQIDTLLIEFEKTTIGQIYIVTLPSLEWRTIEEVALRFGRENGIGDEVDDTWLLILVSPNENVARVEVWYWLEWFITDLQANQLWQQVLVPAFREWNFGLGLYNLTQEIVAVLSWEKEFEGTISDQSKWEITLMEVFILGTFIAFFFGWMVWTWKPNAMTKVITSSIGSWVTWIFAAMVTTWWWLLIAIPLYFVWKSALNGQWKWTRWRSGGYWWGFGGYRWWSFSGWGFGGFGWWSFGWWWATIRW